jgi:hypothetical protein
MFEASEATNAKIEALFAQTADMGRGDFLAHEAIEEVLGIKRHDAGWGWLMVKLRDRLEAERGITLWSERLVGYKLLTVAEHLDVPLRRGRRAIRQLKRGLKSLEALPTNRLNDHQRRLLAFRLDGTRAAGQALRRQMHELDVLARPAEVGPRLPGLIPDPLLAEV